MPHVTCYECTHDHGISQGAGPRPGPRRETRLRLSRSPCVNPYKSHHEFPVGSLQRGLSGHTRAPRTERQVGLARGRGTCTGSTGGSATAPATPGPVAAPGASHRGRTRWATESRACTTTSARCRRRAAPIAVFSRLSSGQKFLCLESRQPYGGSTTAVAAVACGA